jgi:hypothetical protein
MPAITLSDAIVRYGRDAYLLTIGKDGPHTSNVSVDLRGNLIACSLGASAVKNIEREPKVSLFWPPLEPGGYAMILNGTAIGTAAGRRRGARRDFPHQVGPAPSRSETGGQ